MPSLLYELTGLGQVCIPDLVRARVGRSPERPFIRYGDSVWTYADALEQMERFAGYLHSSGAGGSGKRVATYLSNRPEVLWTWFGTHLTGATYVSLNREHKGPVLEDMLRRSGAELLVTDRSAAAQLPAARGSGVRTIVDVDGPPTDFGGGYEVSSWDRVDRSPAAPEHSPDPASTATVMFTSGTTGRSKAVPITHNQFSRNAEHLASALALRPDDVFHGWAPLYHVGGQLYMVMTAIVAGASIALYPAFLASRFWEQVRESGATVFIGFSSVIKILWERTPAAQAGPSTLRVGVIGKIPADLHRPFEQRFGLTLLDMYGMTEAEILTLPRLGEAVPVGSCGRVGPDFDLVILDDRDQVLPPGRVGQICVRSKVPHVMTTGYEGDDAATAEAWRNDWFHTGDLGKIDQDGYVFHVDRLQHAIRRRGENVSSWEVEQILEQHPAIAQAAAIGVPSSLGEEDVKVVVVLRPGMTLDHREVHAFCASRMARFMVPRYIELRPALPYAEVGKVQKEQLKELGPPVWDAERSDT